MAMTVSLSPREAASRISDYVTESGISTECVGMYQNSADDGKEVYMLVFEKYFMRNSSRASLSVIIENLSGVTTVEAVGSGGGEGFLFGFDWGASGSFESLVEKALRSNML